MISLEDFQKKLVESGVCVSDEKAETLLKLQYHLANVCFDNWKRTISSNEARVKTHKENGNCVLVSIYWSYECIYA